MHAPRSRRFLQQPFIYAVGPTNPGDAAQDTDLKQHALDSMGAT